MKHTFAIICCGEQLIGNWQLLVVGTHISNDMYYEARLFSYCMEGTLFIVTYKQVNIIIFLKIQYTLCKFDLFLGLDQFKDKSKLFLLVYLK